MQEKTALLNAMVRGLEAQFKEANDDKESAIREAARCQRKLELANRSVRRRRGGKSGRRAAC